MVIASDIIDLAEEALRNAQHVCNGANIHDMRTVMSLVEFWLIKNKQHSDNFQQLLIEHNIDPVKELLQATNRCREVTLRFTSSKLS
jgi:hypothetical protein